MSHPCLGSMVARPVFVSSSLPQEGHSCIRRTPAIAHWLYGLGNERINVAPVKR